MKIIAVHKCDSWNTPGVIVELSGNEIERIAGPDAKKWISVGREVEITKRFDHSQRILTQADANKKLPGQLRALADTLELSFPAVEAIVTEETESTT